MCGFGGYLIQIGHAKKTLLGGWMNKTVNPYESNGTFRLISGADGTITIIKNTTDNLSFMMKIKKFSHLRVEMKLNSTMFVFSRW